MKNMNINLKIVKKSNFLILLILFLFQTNIFSNSTKLFNAKILTSKNSSIEIKVEIADNDEKRAKGLMYRDKLCKKCGMVFIFNDENYHIFWMKNTKISLDIIYINEKGYIVGLIENTTPYSEDRLSVDLKSKYVLEVAAGFIKKYKIEFGDKFVVKK